MRGCRIPLIAALSLGWIPCGTLAHHAVSGFFDPTGSVEIQGLVTAIRWQNPHTVFDIEVAGEVPGESIEWRAETGALGVLRARGLEREFLHVGDHVRVMGFPSVRGRREVFATNLLLSDGKEVLLTIQARQYFSLETDGELLESIYDPEVVAAARRNADSVFRVWSTNLEERPAAGARMFNGNYPIFPEAAAIRAQWDPGDVTLLGCTEWSMPRLMQNPGPMEFVRQGNDILLRFEEDDNERQIHMGPGSDGRPAEHSLMGYSTGHWDGETLVVETTHMQAGVLDSHGTPHSEDIHILERFTPTPDGARLNYGITLTDPSTYSEPFHVERYWIWRPEIVVGRYACGEEQPFQ